MIQGSSASSHQAEEIGDDRIEPEEFAEAEELAGKPGHDAEKQGLASTVLEVDQDRPELGNMVMESVDAGASTFTPDLMMEKLVQDYRSSKELFGETLIRQLTGYDAEYIEKNINIPEFKRQIEDNITQNIEGLKEDGMLRRDGSWTDEAMELATISLAVQELDHLEARGLIGRRVHRLHANEGAREETKRFAGDPYRNINVAQSVKVAIRRGHGKMGVDDLRVFERESKGHVNVIYAIDASGSMKGKKLTQAKRAGVALAYTAMRAGDNVGLLVFGKTVQRRVDPSKEFSTILRAVARVKSGAETDIAAALKAAIDMVGSQKKGESYHIIILTDGAQTVGANPEHVVVSATAEAVAAGLSVSIVGIGLDEEGEAIARAIVDVGNGHLTTVADVDNLDVIILEQYDRIRR